MIYFEVSNKNHSVCPIIAFEGVILLCRMELAVIKSKSSSLRPELNALCTAYNEVCVRRGQPMAINHVHGINLTNGLGLN